MVQETFTKSTLLTSTGMTPIPVDADYISAKFYKQTRETRYDIYIQ